MDFDAFQASIIRAFGTKDQKRGIDGTFMYFIEEVGELAEALREPSKHDLEGEFADCLAWLVSLAHLAKIDLSRAAENKYMTGCPKCKNTPCTCTSKP